MSDDYASMVPFGEATKVEWSTPMTSQDILWKRQDGWILIAFAYDSRTDRYLYYFAKERYFPL